MSRTGSRLKFKVTGPFPGFQYARPVNVETRKPAGEYPPARPKCGKISCNSPPMPTAFCCAGGVVAVLVNVPIGCGICTSEEPAVVDSCTVITLVPSACPESRKTGLATRESLAL